MGKRTQTLGDPKKEKRFHAKGIEGRRRSTKLGLGPKGERGKQCTEVQRWGGGEKSVTAKLTSTKKPNQGEMQ